MKIKDMIWIGVYALGLIVLTIIMVEITGIRITDKETTEIVSTTDECQCCIEHLCCCKS